MFWNNAKNGRITIAEDWEFDLVLRDRIARFLEERFEEAPSEEEPFEEEPLAEEPLAEEPSALYVASRPLEEDYADAAHAQPSFAESDYAVASFEKLATPEESDRSDREDRAFGHFGAAGKHAREAAPNMAAPSMPALSMPPSDMAAPSYSSSAYGAASSGLKSWLDQIDEPFSTTLLALIDRKGLTDAQVYKRAHMSRQLFSRIRSDANYRPAKKTVLALGLALELTLEEMRDLLERAGFALSHASKRDVIVEYFITQGIYDLFSVNEALYEFDQPLI